MKTAAILSSLAAMVLSAPIAIEPRDGPGCADESFKTPTWTVESFTYHGSWTFSTPAHQIANGAVSFNLTNSAIPDEVAQCSATSSQLQDFFYGTMWYTCQGPSSTIEWTYSRPTDELKLKQTWVCTDREPEWPITFTAAGNHTETLTCVESDYKNPNWTTPGEIYSSRQLDCGPATYSFTPTELSAVAK